MASTDLIVPGATRKPVTLSLMARRLAPLLAAGLIDRDEARDCIMEIAIERGRCDATVGELPWDRVAALEEWLWGVLTREGAR